MHKNKKPLSKRAKLYIVNAAAFVFVVFYFMFDSGIMYTNFLFSLIKSVLLQSGLTFLTLIIYYLSIIADAFSHKNRKKEEDKAASKNGDKNSDTHK